MPSWIPKNKTLRDKLKEEIESIQQERAEFQWNRETETEWQPTTWQNQYTTTQQQLREYQAQAMPTRTATLPQAPTVTPITQKKATVPKTEEVEIPEQVDIPFWQRALSIFAAPFEWVDKNIIKPGMSVLLDPFIPNAKRNEGEDYFAWKRREWEEWKAPGVEFDMPWGKWRLDVKGIAELAPWFLIPGAGQVGGVTRGVGVLGKIAKIVPSALSGVGKTAGAVSEAAGIAGKLGQLGTAGRLLGGVVQYSPWGLVEKGTGLLAKGAAKGLGRISEKGALVSEKIYGKIPEKQLTPEVQKLNQFMKEYVSPVYKNWKTLGHKEKDRIVGAQVQKLRTLHLENQISLDDYEKAVAHVRSGKWKPNVDITQMPLAPEEVKTLREQLIREIEKGHAAVDTQRALDDLLMKGELPQPFYLKQMANVFGDEFASTVKTIAQHTDVLDILNIPRALMASWDLSATLRQGLILGLTHPTKVPKAFWHQLKAYASEKLTMEMDDVIRANPKAIEFVEKGGYLAPMQKGAAKALAEESFMSTLAEKLPMVRRSERAFNTYLNELRVGAYEAASNAMVNVEKGHLELLAKFINEASGRGEIPFRLEKYAPVLNTVLFSPRLQMSRLELPRTLGKMLISDNPYMRKEAAKALGTFLGGGIALLSLLHFTGAATVEIDPRSADFGKIKFKKSDTRLDIWTGYLQYARFITQMMMGESKSAYGNINKQSRWDTAFRFGQSKSAPAVGLLIDMLRGEDYEGQPLFKDTTTALTAVEQRVVPLAVQDMMDAFEQGGANGLLQSAPAILGVGALTYVDKFVQLKNRLAKENGKESWSELDPITQRRLEKLPEFQMAALQFDRDVMGTAWGDYNAAGKAVEDMFQNEVEMATAKYRKTGDGGQYRKDIADAFTARRGGYTARDGEERFSEIIARQNAPTTQEALVKMGAEQLAIKAYYDALYGDDMYDEFGDYRFEEADKREAQLRQTLGEELYQYVKRYVGIKYEDFPPEFQELSNAKKYLKNYWGVEDQVLRMYGRPMTAYQQKRIEGLISKVRKRMKESDPRIAYYLDKFYSY